MHNKWQSVAANCGKESLASNQVVGGSNPSGCAKFIKHLAHFRKLELPHKNKNIKVVIGGCGVILGSVRNSDRFTYRPMTLGATLPKAHTGVVQA